MKNLKSIIVLTLISVCFVSCSDDDINPLPVNEEEVITTLIVTLNPVGSGTTVTMESRDLDGDGPNPPVIEVSSAFQMNTVYEASLELLNETVDPAESITAEIEEEDDEHQFFYTSSNDLVSTSYLDADDDGNPIGLLFSLTTTSDGTANFTVILRHEPNKAAEGVSSGDITNAGGETDIAITFPISIE